MSEMVNRDQGGPSHTTVHVRFAQKADIDDQDVIRRFVPASDVEPHKVILRPFENGSIEPIPYLLLERDAPRGIAPVLRH